MLRFEAELFFETFELNTGADLLVMLSETAERATIFWSLDGQIFGSTTDSRRVT